MHRAGRVDLNQQSIVETLRQVGASVLVTSHIGGGFPDLVAGFRGENFLIEVKNKDTHYGRKGLNKNQIRFQQEWRGGIVHIAYTPDDALKIIGAMKA